MNCPLCNRPMDVCMGIDSIVHVCKFKNCPLDRVVFEVHNADQYQRQLKDL